MPPVRRGASAAASSYRGRTVRRRRKHDLRILLRASTIRKLSVAVRVVLPLEPSRASRYPGDCRQVDQSLARPPPGDSSTEPRGNCSARWTPASPDRLRAILSPSSEAAGRRASQPGRVPTASSSLWVTPLIPLTCRLGVLIDPASNRQEVRGFSAGMSGPGRCRAAIC